MNTGMSDFYKRCFVNVLIFFVVFSIGFSFGKHSERSREKANNKDSGELHSENSFVKLYYMHAMFRCVTCNSIEEKAKQLADAEFAKELANRQIIWEDVNFSENKGLAEKFDVVSSCIVVAVVNGQETLSFERLDEVWTLLEKPDEFNAYLREAIKRGLSKI